MSVRPWLCECGERYPAQGRADHLCAICGLRADNERGQTARVTAVPSRSHPGEHYRVEMREDGTLKCSCRGFGFRGRCRHVEEARGA